MSITCCCPILECVYCLACTRWAWQKCLYTAGHESEHWGLAAVEEFEPVPHLCRLILAVYEDDLHNPLWAPPGGYGIDPDWVFLRRNDQETQSRGTPYLIYLDHDNADIVLAVRGLNLAKESDYAVLLDNKLGQTKSDGGYVHNGLLRAAEWVFEAECEVLRELVKKHPSFALTFAGHSLGAGLVALLAVVAVQNCSKLGIMERSRIKCYAIAPARCMSLNLAVRYADVINLVVLQDDFFTSNDHSFGRCFQITLLTLASWRRRNLKIRDGFMPPDAYTTLLKEGPAGLCFTCISLHPGFRLGRFPPVVRTAVLVDGRFDHMVLSCNATSDHAIIWTERESQRALDLMLEKDGIMRVPAKQKMVRHESLAQEHTEEHKAALRRAVALDIPQAYSPSSYGTFNEMETAQSSGGSSERGF